MSAHEVATMSEVVPKNRRCVPDAGKWPGELHEALYSWTDAKTHSVRLRVRHIASGDCSEVDLFKTKFGEAAR